MLIGSQRAEVGSRKIMPKNTFYITTSIPYMNARVHIGHALEAAQADAIARFWRLQGEKVFFLTGTDEYGKKIQEAAQKAGKGTAEFVDEMAEYYKKVCDTLGISYDNLIRTSDQEKHWPAVFAVWKKLLENGDIYKGSYEGYYCTGCEAFLREAEMENGICLIHKKPVQKVSEENYFFRFSKYVKEVERLIREDVIKILPTWRKLEILNLFSDEGTRDVSFSRPKETVGWGIPVPDDPGQMIYVWVDALVNYISGAGFKVPEILRCAQDDNEMAQDDNVRVQDDNKTAQDDNKKVRDDKTEVRGESKFEERWPADVHLIGKDIARFHLMIWPAMLLSLGLELPKAVYIHGFISVEGEKISKSLGNVVDPIELVEKYGSAGSPQAGKDAVRYFLLREIPSGGDGDFSYARFEERYTADLQNGLGNLVSRVAAVGEKHQDIFQDIKLPADSEIAQRKIYKDYCAAIDRFELHETLTHTQKLVAESNKLVEDSALWDAVKNDQEKAVRTMALLAENLFAIAYMLQPFMPDTAEKIFHSLGGKEAKTVRFRKPEQPLFPRGRASAR